MNLKIAIAAAALAVAAPVASFAATVTGSVSIGGTVPFTTTSNLTDGDTSTGMITFDPTSAAAGNASGSIDDLVCTTAEALATECSLTGFELSTIDLANLGTFWVTTTGLSFDITSVSSVSVMDNGAADLVGTGSFFHGGEETAGFFSLSIDPNAGQNPTATVGFSSTATAVPVPAAGLLLLGGLGGLAALRRRKKADA